MASRGSLEEITNQIFEDLMRGKAHAAHQGFDELGVCELHGKQHSKPAKVNTATLVVELFYRSSSV